jgi:hypothetical protein
MGEPEEVTIGISQGFFLSTALFIIFNEDLMEELNRFSITIAIAWIDDVSFLAVGADTTTSGSPCGRRQESAKTGATSTRRFSVSTDSSSFTSTSPATQETRP